MWHKVMISTFLCTGSPNKSNDEEWEVVDKAESLKGGNYVGPATFRRSMSLATPEKGKEQARQDSGRTSAQRPAGLEAPLDPWCNVLHLKPPALLICENFWLR
jgi:hypothetical protein